MGGLLLGVLEAQGRTTTYDPHTAAWETTNLHGVATVLAANAKARQETRGSHWREDYPDTDDAQWHVRLVSTLDADGVTWKERFAALVVGTGGA